MNFLGVVGLGTRKNRLHFETHPELDEDHFSTFPPFRDMCFFDIRDEC